MANPIHFTLRSMLSFVINEQADLGTVEGESIEALGVGQEAWFEWTPGSSPADWVPDGVYEEVSRGEKKFTFQVENDCKKIKLERTA